MFEFLFYFTIKGEVKVIKLPYLFAETKVIDFFIYVISIKANRKYRIKYKHVKR